MNKTAKVFWLAAMIMLAGIVLFTACSTEKDAAPANPGGSFSPQPGNLTRTSSGGGVDIEVTWLSEVKDPLIFEVTMNTHSVDLDGVNLKQLAMLRDSQGAEYRPLSWDAPAGGHHRAGRLSFAAPQGGTASFSLLIRDVAGVSERKLEWKPG